MASLPSRFELEQARVTISEQETALKDARAALVGAEQRVVELEEDLKLRRAWIAPIRKLNFDTLSQVLILASQNDWKAPLRLGGVSRQWRHATLKTPSAWSLFDCPKKPKKEILDLYLQRSGSTPLHLRRWADLHSWIDDMGYSEALYREHSTRIKCIGTAWLEYMESLDTLPNLELLHVGNLTLSGGQPSPDLAKRRFPYLRALRVGYTAEPEENQPHLEPTPIDRPHVESLLIRDGLAVLIGPLIGVLATTLTSLQLYGVRGTFQPLKISLPKLRHLHLQCTTRGRHNIDSILKTPALQSYVQHDCGWTTLQYSDLDTITCFRLYDHDWPRHYSLNHFPAQKLRILQTPQILLETAEALIRDTSAYPALLAIQVWHIVVEVPPEDEFYAELEGLCAITDFGPRIAEANGARQKPVEIVITREWSNFEDDQGILVSRTVEYCVAFDKISSAKSISYDNKDRK